MCESWGDVARDSAMSEGFLDYHKPVTTDLMYQFCSFPLVPARAEKVAGEGPNLMNREIYKLLVILCQFIHLT